MSSKNNKGSKKQQVVEPEPTSNSVVQGPVATSLIEPGMSFRDRLLAKQQQAPHSEKQQPVQQSVETTAPSIEIKTETNRRTRKANKQSDHVETAHHNVAVESKVAATNETTNTYQGAADNEVKGAWSEEPAPFEEEHRQQQQQQQQQQQHTAQQYQQHTAQPTPQEIARIFDPVHTRPSENQASTSVEAIVENQGFPVLRHLDYAPHGPRVSGPRQLFPTPSAFTNEYYAEVSFQAPASGKRPHIPSSPPGSPMRRREEEQQREIDTLNSQVEHLSSQLQQETHRLREQLTDARSGAQTSTQRYRQDLANLQSNYEQLLAAKSERDEECKRLAQENSMAKKRLNDIEQELGSLQSQNAQLQNQLYSQPQPSQARGSQLHEQQHYEAEPWGEAPYDSYGQDQWSNQQPPFAPYSHYYPPTQRYSGPPMGGQPQWGGGYPQHRGNGVSGRPPQNRPPLNRNPQQQQPPSSRYGQQSAPFYPQPSVQVGRGGSLHPQSDNLQW